MALLEKLAIQGIRSFDTEDRQILKFFSPLTLILGQNGTGKTTIIESLKYIATGEFPPGLGSNFLLDPKIANAREVIAQVRLQFTNSVGKKYTVTRSSKNTQLEKKTCFSSLDAVIRHIDENGKTVDFNAKCGDINSEMINLLGVSKAVLSNVIFCHQEDSNWPLSEGKILKTKFDQIFSATRYAKALVKIQDTRKERAGQLKLCEKELIYLKEYKNLAENKRDELSKQDIRLQQTKDEIIEVDIKLKPIRERLVELKNYEEEIVEIKNKIETKKAQIVEMNKYIENVEKNIGETFEGNLAELVTTIEDFQSQLELKKFQNEKRLDELNRVQQDVRRNQEEISTLLVSLGNLESEGKHHENQVEGRNAKMLNLLEECSMSYSDLGNKLHAKQVTDIISKLEQHHDNLESKNLQSKQKYERQESVLQDAIQGVRDQKSTLEEKENGMLCTIEKNKMEIRKIINDLDDVDTSAAAYEILQEDLLIAENDLQKNEKCLNLYETESDISKLELEESDLQKKVVTLRNEMRKANQLTKTRADVDHLKMEKLNKEALIRKIYSNHEEAFKNSIGCVPTENVASKVSIYLEQKSNEENTLRSSFNYETRDLSKLETQKLSACENLEQCRRKLSKLKNQVYDVCGSKNYSEEVILLGKSVEDLQKDKGSLTGSLYIYKKFIEKLNRDCQSCPVCHRDFTDKNDATLLITELENSINLIPGKVNNKAEALNLKQKQYEKVLQLKPVEDQIERLVEKEIPELEKSIAEMKENIDDKKQKTTNLETKVHLCVIQQTAVRETQRDLGLLDQSQIDVKKLDRDIEKILSSFPSGWNDKRTTQQIEKDQSDVEMELDLKRNKAQFLKDQINNYNQNLIDSREKVTKLKEDLQILSQKMGDRSNMEEKRANLSCEIKNLQSNIQDSKHELESVKQNLSELEEKKMLVVSQKEAELNNENKLIKDFETKLSEIKSYQNQILRYLNSGKREEYCEQRSKLSCLKVEVDTKEKRAFKLNGTIEKQKEELNLSEVRHRELNDNLSRIKKVSERNRIKIEIKELETKFGDKDFRHLEQEKKRLNREYGRLSDNFHVASGRKDEVKETIRNLKKELEGERLKNADESYKNMMIQSKTTEIVINDLITYYQAVDFALNRYHKVKMAVVNKRIRELWQKTYRGNDIDYIQVDCGDENGNVTAKRKAVNYRVVFVKGDTWLDMRCRCSAGQKVLACLIIRLALAETFCLHCGVLCLDEPTTNLDRDNIESLAQALNTIVEDHSMQKNFQLIVITHDHDFIEQLSQGKSAEHFYRVYKNDDGFSKISKVTIDKL